MSTRTRSGALGLVAVAALAAAPAPTSLADHGGCADGDVLAVDAATQARSIAALRCLVDRLRLANGRTALAASGRLSAAAQRHAREMSRLDYVAHVDRAGRDLDARVRATGYPRSGRAFHVSETLAWGIGRDGTARGVLNVLERSPAHRGRMLRPDVRDLGVGMATGIPVGRRGRGTTVSLIVGRR